ncbi:MAG: preprotein translocase subunit YajC [Acidimicrobiales bacterium]|nr:preprotein translocase subunit YajC [Acidimicrobiales bacterium]
MDLLIFLAVMVLFVWGFMILPQQRRAKRHNELVASIQPGDELLTTAGIYGTVTDVFDDDIFLEVSPGVEIRIASAAVASKIDFEDDAGDDRADDDRADDDSAADDTSEGDDAVEDR